MSRLFRDTYSGATSYEWSYSGPTTAFTLSAASPNLNIAAVTQATMFFVVVTTQCRFKVGKTAVAGSADAIMPIGKHLIGVIPGYNLSLVRDTVDCIGTVTVCE